MLIEIVSGIFGAGIWAVRACSAFVLLPRACRAQCFMSRVSQTPIAKVLPSAALNVAAKMGVETLAELLVLVMVGT
jgi:hypothetical protein